MNRTKEKTFSLCLSCIILIIGCAKERITEQRLNRPSDVYVAGAQQNGNNSIWTATYWKNSNATSLTSGLSDGRLTGISVSLQGSDTCVYAVGYDGQTLKYWKNGLSNVIGGNATAKGITVDHDDVYIWGSRAYPEYGNAYFPVVWKNGAVKSFIPITSSIIEAVAVSGSQIYVAGNLFGWETSHPFVWVNSTESWNDWDHGDIKYLSPGAFAGGAVFSIFISGSDIYVGGSSASSIIVRTPRALYWKNYTEVVTLTDGTFEAAAMAITIDGTDVYAAGYEKNSKGIKVAKCWKNGIPTTLSDGTRSQMVYSIKVANGDVYATGVEVGDFDIIPNSPTTLWKNGKVIPPFDGTNIKRYGYALCVY